MSNVRNDYQILLCGDERRIVCRELGLNQRSELAASKKRLFLVPRIHEPSKSPWCLLFCYRCVKSSIWNRTYHASVFLGQRRSFSFIVLRSIQTCHASRRLSATYSRSGRVPRNPFGINLRRRPNPRRLNWINLLLWCGVWTHLSVWYSFKCSSCLLLYISIKHLQNTLHSMKNEWNYGKYQVNYR